MQKKRERKDEATENDDRLEKSKRKPKGSPTNKEDPELPPNDPTYSAINNEEFFGSQHDSNPEIIKDEKSRSNISMDSRTMLQEPLNIKEESKINFETDLNKNFFTEIKKDLGSQNSNPQTAKLSSSLFNNDNINQNNNNNLNPSPLNFSNNIPGNNNITNNFSGNNNNTTNNNQQHNTFNLFGSLNNYLPQSSKKNNDDDKSFDNDDEFNFNLNYEKNQQLKFLKDLAIILEGIDKCTAVGLEDFDFLTGPLLNENKIFVTCNNFGKFEHQSQLNKEVVKQETLIKDVLKDLVNKTIDLNNFDSCRSLLEILLSNIMQYGRPIDNDLRSMVKVKEKYFHYLFPSFKKLRPKQSVRLALGVPDSFAVPKIQNRIRRFSLAIIDLLNSQFYSEFIVTKKIDIEIKHQSPIGVHVELKLLDYFVKEYIFDKNLTSAVSQIDNKTKKKIHVAPSRMACIDCKSLIMEINKLNYPIYFIFPKEKSSVLKYRFHEPDFLSHIPNNDKYKDFLKLRGEYQKTKDSVDTKQKKGERYEILKNTDSAPPLNEISQYKIFDPKSTSNFTDGNLEKFVLLNSLSNIKMFCNSNMGAETAQIAIQIKGYLDTLNFNNIKKN